MSELDKIVMLFSEIGLECYQEKMHDHYMGWFDFPPDWKDFTIVGAVAAVFVFNWDGKFVGVGIGDEQSSYELRVESR